MGPMDLYGSYGPYISSARVLMGSTDLTDTMDPMDPAKEQNETEDQ